MGLINDLADIGQMGSGHTKTAANTLYAPTGKVIVAIQVLNAAVKFSALVADDSFVGSGSASVDDGVSYIGSGTQFLANGEDDDGDAVVSEAIANTVEFPANSMIYGRWTNVSLQANSTHGIIVYYGPAA
tara:strand:- start:755 stop:1144 length:390 start_codon:yes stop_codon:yes gene_type:complete